MSDPEAQLLRTTYPTLHQKLGDDAFSDLVLLIRKMATETATSRQTADAISRRIANDMRLRGG